MRDLVQQDSDGGDGAHCWTDQKRRPHGQAVGEIVDEVGCQVQVTRHLDVWVGGQNDNKWSSWSGTTDLKWPPSETLDQ